MRKIAAIFIVGCASAALAACASYESAVQNDVAKVNNFVCNNQELVIPVAVAVKDNAAITSINSACPAVLASEAANSAVSK